MTRALLSLCVLVSLPVFAMGPVLEGGANITLPQTTTSGSSTVVFSSLVGPVARAGFEIGERFNHALVFEFTQSSGTGTTAGVTLPVGVQTLAGRYTFSVDFLKKDGFTPSLGVGLAVGTVNINVGNASTVNGNPTSTSRLYLAFHAVAGARYTFKNGFGLRLDLAASTYGGFVGLQPTAGLSYRF